ncbi:MAG TPA: hypothetical protein VND64_23830 [Pirellulales bacterium]|nr:hypothetical protein [Pirellulales bacterium]
MTIPDIEFTHAAREVLAQFTDVRGMLSVQARGAGEARPQWWNDICESEKGTSESPHYVGHPITCRLKPSIGRLP